MADTVESISGHVETISTVIRSRASESVETMANALHNE